LPPPPFLFAVIVASKTMLWSIKINSKLDYCSSICY
jgi:hypothetical protein